VADDSSWANEYSFASLLLPQCNRPAKSRGFAVGKVFFDRLRRYFSAGSALA